jgi:hypothetical protein
MTHWFTSFRRRGAKRARALRAPLHLEALEERNLLARLVFVPSPLIPAELVGAAAISASDIWAVGSQSTGGTSQTPLAEHFDGTSWSVVSTPSPTSDSVFESVAAAASNDVWAVGFGGTNNATLIEHWNGTNWTEVSSPTMPTGSMLQGVTAPASNNVWAVGNNSGSANALVEHWDGTSWSVVSSPAFAGASFPALKGGFISADSTTDVWALARASTGSAAVLHWDGQTWSIGLTAGGADLAVTALSPTNVWAAGFTSVRFPHRNVDIAFVEHWDGTSWSIVPSPNPNVKNPILGSKLQGIAAISANDIWAVGKNEGSTLTEHWDGMNWKIVDAPNPGQSNSLSAVTALNDGTVAAVGSQFSSATGTTPLILQNGGGSAPNPATKATPLAASPMSRETSTALPTRATTILHAAVADRLFAAVSQANQPLSFAGHSSRENPMADNGERDAFGGTIWLWDRA